MEKLSFLIVLKIYLIIIKVLNVLMLIKSVIYILIINWLIFFLFNWLEHKNWMSE